MFRPTLIRKWFSGLPGKRSTLSAKKASRRHLALECLEERLALSFSPVVPGDLGSLALELTRMAVTGFGKVSDNNVSGGYKPQLVAAGDFNGDLQKDLVITNGNRTYSVLLSDGTGKFTALPPAVLTGPGTDSTEGIGAGDFNHDGKLDLAVASYGDGVSQGAVTILLGNGNGTFRQTGSLYLPPGKNGDARPTYLAAADLEKSGNLDLIVSDFQNDKVLIYHGNGDGTFDFHDYVESNDVNKLAGPNQLVVADLDRDGILDVAVADKNNGSVSVLKGLGGGYLTTATNINLPAYGSVGLAAGDLDGDGKVDLAVANFGTGAAGAHALSIVANTSAGPGNFSFAVQPNITVGDHLINVVIADFDGDGRNGIAVTSAGNTEDDSTTDNSIWVLRNLPVGAGSLLFYVAPLPLVTGSNPQGLIATDLDGNGTPELVSANQASDTVSVFVNLADPSRFRNLGLDHLRLGDHVLPGANGNALASGSATPARAPKSLQTADPALRADEYFARMKEDASSVTVEMIRSDLADDFSTEG